MEQTLFGVLFNDIFEGRFIMDMNNSSFTAFDQKNGNRVSGDLSTSDESQLTSYLKWLKD